MSTGRGYQQWSVIYVTNRKFFNCKITLSHLINGTWRQWRLTASEGRQQDDIESRTPLRYGRKHQEIKSRTFRKFGWDKVDADTKPRRSLTTPSEAPMTSTWRFPTGPPATPTIGARPRQHFRPQNRRDLFNDMPVSSTRTAWNQTRSYAKCSIWIITYPFQIFFQTDPPNRCWMGSFSIGKMWNGTTCFESSNSTEHILETKTI